MRLDRERIVDAAMALLDEVGLDAFSTRALAARLGVRQPALYWHFRNRRALLEAMNARMIAEAHRRRLPEDGEDWRAFLTANAESFRETLLSRRDGARIHAGTEASPDDLALTERLLEFLAGAGWPPAEALDLLVAISRYTVGCVLEQQADPDSGEKEALDRAAAEYPLVSEAVAHYRRQGHAAAFGYGLGLLLDGAAARLEEASGRRADGARRADGGPDAEVSPSR